MTTLFGSTQSSATSSSSLGDLKNDVELANPPEDSISDLAFSPDPEQANDHLAVASWDKKVRIYEITQTGQNQGVAQMEHDAPVLSVDFFRDGKKVISGGADNNIKVLDLVSGQTTQVKAHDQPVKCVRTFTANGTPMAVTGSWDKTIKYWDFRSDQPAMTVACQERVYALDVRDDLLVVGTADRYLNVVKMNDPSRFYKTIQSPLKWQTRVVSCFLKGKGDDGYAIGSIEGRCAIQYVEEKDSASNFSFKCHRDTPQGNVTNVHALNAISFHPQHGTFSTAGSDGTFHFWDKDAKHRLKGYPTVGGSINATAFNKSGAIFAYSVSYDWSKGYQGNVASYPRKIMLHPVIGDECKPRPSVKKR